MIEVTGDVPVNVMFAIEGEEERMIGRKAAGIPSGALSPTSARSGREGIEATSLGL
jgi:hypothetical protein